MAVCYGYLLALEVKANTTKTMPTTRHTTDMINITSGSCQNVGATSDGITNQVNKRIVDIELKSRPAANATRPHNRRVFLAPIMRNYSLQ